MFETKGIVYLSHLISSKEVELDPEKMQWITGMPPPTNKSEILTLQGNYLAKFLTQLSEVMQPIRELTKDDVEFVWLKGQEDALEVVKKPVTSTAMKNSYCSVMQALKV